MVQQKGGSSRDLQRFRGYIGVKKVPSWYVAITLDLRASLYLFKFRA